MRRRPPRSTRTDTLFPYTTLFRSDVRAVDTVIAANGGTLITVKLPQAELCLTVAAPGEHWVSNALAILAAVESVGGDLAQAGLALAELPGLPGRGARSQVPFADGEALVIDESYNANPQIGRAHV